MPVASSLSPTARSSSRNWPRSSARVDSQTGEPASRAPVASSLPMMPGSTTRIGLRGAWAWASAPSQAARGRRLSGSGSSICSQPRVRASSSAIGLKPVSTPASAARIGWRVNEPRLK